MLFVSVQRNSSEVTETETVFVVRHMDTHVSQLLLT